MGELVKFSEEEITAALASVIAIVTQVEGARTSIWKSRLQRDLLNDLMDALRESLANGEDINQAITRVVGGNVESVLVTGALQKSQRQLDTIIGTAVAAVSNAARIATFQENTDVVKGIQQVSTLDNRTSQICIAYSGQAWDVQTLEPIMGSTLPFNNGPPRHFNCRSTLVPVLRSWEELGIPLAELGEGQRASMDGALPGNITLDQWLRGKTKTFQDTLLGPARARLWRSNSITLTQLVDMRGNPMTVEQLKKKIASRLRS